MQKIYINGTEYIYSDSQVITFPEGLVGMPDLRNAVIVPLPDFEPFAWLVSIDDERGRFIVVDPHLVFNDYKCKDLDGSAETLAIVTISSDWHQTTINLKAPIVIDRSSGRGVQRVLTDSPYGLAESIPY